MGCWSALNYTGTVQAPYGSQVADRHENTKNMCFSPQNKQCFSKKKKKDLKAVKKYTCRGAAPGSASCKRFEGRQY